MKLKAPQGVGDPSVAGVTFTPRDGVYDVEPEIGVHLIECFGFVEVGETVAPKARAAPGGRRRQLAARKV